MCSRNNQWKNQSKLSIFMFWRFCQMNGAAWRWENSITLVGQSDESGLSAAKEGSRRWERVKDDSRDRIWSASRWWNAEATYQNWRVRIRKRVELMVSILPHWKEYDYEGGINRFRERVVDSKIGYVVSLKCRVFRNQLLVIRSLGHEYRCDSHHR